MATEGSAVPPNVHDADATANETHCVDPGTIPVWRLHATLTTLLAAVGSTFLGFAHGRLWSMLPVAIVLIGLVFSWLWPPLYYRHLSYRIDGTGIRIRRGVLWQSFIALPRARIQHTDVSQGPLQRRFGVGTLKLYTAGSKYTKIELPGLAHAEAISLRDALLAEGDDSGV